jgi:hypothetical protein
MTGTSPVMTIHIRLLLAISRETQIPRNETKTKRNRFAREILSIAKPLISLSPTKAEFRGFEPFQGLMRFAKRFFEFCGRNVLPQYLAGLPLSRR